MKPSIIRIGLFSALLLIFAAALLSVGTRGWGSLPTVANAARPYGATDYCTETGGAVVVRIPVFGTNGSDPLQLSGMRNFCEYTASDGSKIDLLTDTLYTAQPSLAALAYYAQVTPGTCNGNPASCYCSLLGGTDLFGGINASGGGWVKKGTLNDVLDACIFPDQSSIDSWGLFYHSADIIRGIDLSTVLKYPNPYRSQGASK